MIDQGDPGLKRRLIVSDATVLFVVWTLLLWFGPHAANRSKPRSLGLVALATAVACLAIWRVGLLLYRRCAVRATEMRLLVRVTLFTVVFMLLFDRILLTTTGVRFYVKEAIWGAVVMLLALTIERGVWRAVLRASRQSGRRERRVIVVGTNSDGKRLIELFRAHPEHGLRVVGVAGSRSDAKRNALDHLWLGTVHDVEQLFDEQALSGIVVAAGPMDHPHIDELVRRLLARGAHVHVSTGLAGMDINRFRHLPMAREPMLYLEGHRLGRLDQIAKRTFDVAVSGAMIVLLAPLLLAIAAAIKLSDRGPVFYRQVRGGRAGTQFRVIKFRTMVVDADAKLAEVAHLNTREGALFKADNDPRITRVGRLLRLSSLDELPQLFNTFIGQMSIVGPRPALPAEIEQFDAELRTRDVVRPGITGLWQVEARDSPSADAYRRLDLFYVENWSLMGDIVIMLDTAEHLLGRIYRATKRTDTVSVLVPPTFGGEELPPAAKSA